MTENQQRNKAKTFSEYWNNKGYEKGESQPFWLNLLRDVFGVEHPEAYISFEDQVFLGHTSFIDGYIPSTKVLIEQKAIGKDLTAQIRQSDGSFLTPFQQAKRYITELPVSKHPRYVVTCNFQEFLVYDMENPSGEPEKILLKDLEKEYTRLSFLVDAQNPHLKREMELSMKAGDIVGVLYDALLDRYIKPVSESALKSLNILCVRIVFCLYAEDAGIFGHKNMFHDYLQAYDAHGMRNALIELFKVLNTPAAERDPYMDETLGAFPYANGGLFAEENIEIPQFTDEIRNLILSRASDDFDWSEISPTIFGAVFESTLNPETRRSGGMHYTSIENIHKVIDPLFLDGLKDELAEIKAVSVERTRKNRLKAFQDKLASLTFLDPAAGSGNFLTESFVSIRRLENEVINALEDGQMFLGDALNPIRCSIQQFYGIEINDFAVTVAKTALWIAESQMMKETEDIIHKDLDFLPLKTNAYIIEGNALKLDWNDVAPRLSVNYIMGNPPFVGARLMNKVQKQDVIGVFGKDWKNVGNLDYVCCWYKKAADYMKGTRIKTAFVSTNSVSQGETVASLWKNLFKSGISICFAYRTFIWDSEANTKAHVHCVIIGFSYAHCDIRYLYDGKEKVSASRINAYLIDADDVFVESRKKVLCDVPEMVFGSMANDSGFFILDEDEKETLIKKEPQAIDYIRPFLGATEFINNHKRYCLWLKGTNPSQIKDLHYVMDRVRSVKETRESSKRDATRKLAATPTLFGEIRQPESGQYLLVPRVSSERRQYIPMGFLNSNVIASDAVQIIPHATLYHFGVLTSSVHMAWMRAVCGRLKSDYRYSKDVVYNNFPWCNPSPEQRNAIEKTAQMILDARALYPDCSLADLYDELTMPPELRKAHRENDKAVLKAYGLPTTCTENERVAFLLQLYQKLVST